MSGIWANRMKWWQALIKCITVRMFTDIWSSFLFESLLWKMCPKAPQQPDFKWCPGMPMAAGLDQEWGGSRARAKTIPCCAGHCTWKPEVSFGSLTATHRYPGAQKGDEVGKVSKAHVLWKAQEARKGAQPGEGSEGTFWLGITPWQETGRL